ncbi:MAG: alpha/beta hydrolase [Alphaproteobacteria bacterium]|nr:alpha/beta hydrolase [Alphaproteobacteria bacterium]
MDAMTIGLEPAKIHLILAHGAGAPMTSVFMQSFAELVAAQGVRVTRFHFPYMTEQVRSCRRRPPPRVDRLGEHYCDVVRTVAGARAAKQRLFIGGKSMGGRVATMVADALYEQDLCKGVVCLGYPFHPAGKPEQLRTAHLEAIRAPTLIVQGERDALGNQGEVATYALAETISVVWAKDGDHDLKPRKRSGVTFEDNLKFAADAAVQHMQRTKA